MKQPPQMAMLLEHAQWLRGLAVALTRGDADADDVVQETWLAALRSPPDQQRPPRPWLSQVLRNSWRMVGRTAERRRARECAAYPEQDSPAGAHDVLERAELQRHLADLVIALDEPYRTALLLRYYEGKSAKQIGHDLQVPAGTVRWRITEGLSRLRARFDRDAGNAGDRRRWRAGLLVLAGPLRPPPPKSVPANKPRAATGAAWTAGTVLAVSVLVAGALRSSAVRRFRPQALPAGKAAAVPPPDSQRRDRTDTKEDEMTQSKLMRAAALFGVAMPALIASAEGGGRELTREENVRFCVRRWEKIAACKEDFADHFSSKMPPEKREAHRARFIEKALEAGTGPLEPRQEKCAESVDRVQPRLTDHVVSQMEACFSAGDCKAVVLCMKPILDSGPAKKPAL